MARAPRRRVRFRRSWAACAALAVLLPTIGLAVGGPASADAGSTLTYPLTAPVTVVNGNGYQVIRSAPARQLAAGDAIHLTGRVQATSNVTRNVMEGVSVRCLDAAGRVAGQSGYTTRNHEGSDTTTYSPAGQLAVTVNWLFTAPASGAYTCQMLGRASATTPATAALTFQPTSSYLAMSAVSQSGARQWVGKVCDAAGATAGCTYLGGSRNGVANPTSTFVFATGTAGSAWSTASSTRAVEVLADVSVTTCYVGTATCTLSGGQLVRGANAVVDTRLVVVQLNAAGGTCAVTRVPAAGTGSSTDKAYYRTTIRDETHHLKIHHRVARLAASSACGTSEPRFSLRLEVRRVSGQPVKIEGSSGTAVLSNAIAMEVP